jgi:hypothetical protein
MGTHRLCTVVKAAVEEVVSLRGGEGADVVAAAVVEVPVVTVAIVTGMRLFRSLQVQHGKAVIDHLVTLAGVPTAESTVK